MVKYSAGNGQFNGFNTVTFWQSATEEQLSLPDAICAGDQGQKCSRPYKHILMPMFMQSDLVKQVKQIWINIIILCKPQILIETSS